MCWISECRTSLPASLLPRTVGGTGEAQSGSQVTGEAAVRKQQLLRPVPEQVQNSKRQWDALIKIN